MKSVETFDEYLHKHEIVKAEDLPHDEKLYFKKDALGWRMITPIKSEDGTFNWKAMLIGSWRNIIGTTIIILILILIMCAYSHDINVIKERAKECIENPVEYCNKLLNPMQFQADSGVPKFNFSGDEIE